MALELKDDSDISTVKDADLVADGDKDASYQIRHLTIEKHRELVKARTKQVLNKRTHQKDDVPDWEAISDDILDYVLTDWAGVVAKGAPLPCELAHKLRLDGPRRTAILERAGMNEIAAAPERRAESFREAAGVR